MIERRRVGAARLGALLASADAELEVATAIEPLGHLTKAVAAVYEAGFRACVAILGSAGYRLRSRAGHHHAALEAALTLLGPVFEAEIDRMNDARELRNADLYGIAPPASQEQLDLLKADARRLIDAARSRASKRS